MTLAAQRVHHGVNADGVALVRLDHPPANAIDLAMCEALVTALHAVDSAQAIVLTGSGKLFCGGGDLPSFLDDDGLDNDLLRATACGAAEVVRTVVAGPPIVAAINGPVAGAGLGLALCCDARICVPGTRFVGGFAQLGLSPDTSTSFFLPRTIGRARALRLLLDPRGIGTDQALEWGLVDAIEPAGRMLDAARTLAGAWAKGPRQAVVTSRTLVDAEYELEAHLAEEVRNITRLCTDPIVGQRMRAFVGGGTALDG